MAKGQPSNVKPFRKRIHINLGTIVFGLVFVYIVCIVIMYFTRNRVSIYEVQTGSIVENQTYTGLALRQEHVCSAESSGYLTYIAHEGSRVGVRSPVYSTSADENVFPPAQDGDFVTGSLTEDDYETIFNEITGFTTGYDKNAFQNVYVFKSGINSAVIDALNSAAYTESGIENLQGVLSSPDSGVVIYGMDGMEAVTYETFTPDMLNKNNYTYEDFRSRESISAGQPAYKLVTGEEWELIINIDDSQRDKYVDDEYIQVRFLKDQAIVWAQIACFEKDGDWFCRLRFTNSMIRYVTERFLEVEVILETAAGLKVPNSAIVEKEFYTVPREFLVFDDTENTVGVYLHEVNNDGKASDIYQQITPYNLTEEEAFFNKDDLKEGTVLSKEGSTDLYTLRDLGKLVGVYNVNRGYADFSIVTVLYQNDDYSIVRANESYGLTQYDHIVLDGSSVNDEETIYQ